MHFKELSIIPPILRALREAGYNQPTPIQQQAIPPVLAGRDLVGCAQTGTGKTAAFAIPILQRLSATPVAKQRKIRALILTPTRELALQIYQNFVQYGSHLPLRSGVIFGGVSQEPQVRELQRGVDVLIATPGRLWDLMGQGFIRLGGVEIFVLDEADRMLDMGFIADVRRIAKSLSTRRQNLLFSATMPDEILGMVDEMLSSPVWVRIDPEIPTVEAIRQTVYFVDKAKKIRLLEHLLKAELDDSTLVFTRTKHGADRVVRMLGRAGIKALAIHGNKSQNARQNALEQFKNGHIKVLVATDIAARGIDINELGYVINYDLPNIPETYVHRIGRTGRAGREGMAIAFCDIEERPYLRDIEKLMGKQLEELPNTLYPPTATEPVPPPMPRPSAKLKRGEQAAASNSPSKTARQRRRRPRRRPEGRPPNRQD
jgi:ATP-dependent RNA helicase RhlE